VVVNIPAPTPLVESGFVTRTSHTTARFGPFEGTLTVTLSWLELTKTTLVAVGTGPPPFSNDTPAPDTKFEPFTITVPEVPLAIEAGLTDVTVTEGEFEVTVTVIWSVPRRPPASVTDAVMV